MLTGCEQRPSISVIVPTYNRGNLLKDTITSILGQTFEGFELIVVDDGSTDNTRDIVNDVKDQRIKYMHTENWGGPARPRNIGIRAGKGEFVALCDDDDIWYPDKLRCQLAALKDRPFGLCFTNFDYIDANSKKLDKVHKIKKLFRNPTFNRFVLGGGAICNSSVMIRHSVVDAVGLLEEDPELVAMEDYQYWARIIRKYKACCVDKVLVSYRVNSQNSMEAITDRNWLTNQMYLLNAIRSSVEIAPAIYYTKMVKILIQGLLRFMTNK